MTTPPLLGDRTWRRRHSRWLLGPILGIGFLSGFFLFRVAFKMKDRDEMRRILVLYTVPTIVVWIALATSNPDAAKDRPIDVVGQILMMVLWVAGIVHANIINRRYLPWKVSRGEVPAPGATTVQGSASVRAGQQPGWSAQLGLAEVQHQAWAPTNGHPASTPPTPVPPAAPVAADPYLNDNAMTTPPPSSDGQLLDVNTADEAQLRTLPGIGPALAKRIIVHRDATGGFTSVQDLATAGVPPHVMAGLQQSVAFGSPKRSSTRRGRVLDI